MARPVKDGLDYFPMDVDLFSDRKIKSLLARHGGDGLSLYIYILCETYRDKGYYLQVDDDFQDVAVLDLGMSYEKIGLLLKFLLDKSLFDSTLFSTDKILTSRSIQRRYQNAVGARGAKRRIVVNKKLWLLEPAETESFIQLYLGVHKSENNPHYSENNSGKSGNNPPKESKGKKSNKGRLSGAALDRTTDDDSPDSQEEALLRQVLARVEPGRLQPEFWGESVSDYLRTMFYAPGIRVNGHLIPRIQVRKRMQQLDRESVQHMLDRLKNAGDIDNIKGYLVASLYNAPADYNAWLNAEVAKAVF